MARPLSKDIRERVVGAVAGGLGKPLDVETALRAAGWTDADIKHVCNAAEVYRRLAGDDEAAGAVLSRRLAAESVATIERFDRKLVRQLLHDLRAAEDADESA
jgi:hypothetical protein